MKPSGQDNGFDSQIQTWLRWFAQCVRKRDMDEGRAMFAPGVVGFGTWTPRAKGLDALIEQAVGQCLAKDTCV